MQHDPAIPGPLKEVNMAATAAPDRSRVKFTDTLERQLIKQESAREDTVQALSLWAAAVTLAVGVFVILANLGTA